MRIEDHEIPGRKYLHSYSVIDWYHTDERGNPLCERTPQEVDALIRERLKKHQQKQGK